MSSLQPEINLQRYLPLPSSNAVVISLIDRWHILPRCWVVGFFEPLILCMCIGVSNSSTAKMSQECMLSCACATQCMFGKKIANSLVSLHYCRRDIVCLFYNKKLPTYSFRRVRFSSAFSAALCIEDHYLQERMQKGQDPFMWPTKRNLVIATLQAEIFELCGL